MASSLSFRRLPLGAGSILGVYVTVLVTTSRMCLTLVPFLSQRLECTCCWFGPALVGAGPTSAYLLARSAASQSKGLLTLLALQGDRMGLSTAGLGGTRRLGNVAGPVAGAESGRVPAAEADALVTEMGAGFDDLGAGARECSFEQLQSVAALMLVAEVGALSRSSSVVLSRDSSVLIVSTVALLFALSPVDVLFRGALLISGAVSGGLAMDGEAGLIVLRKSM